MRITENDNLKNLTDYVEDLTTFNELELIVGSKKAHSMEAIVCQAWIYIKENGVRKRITVKYAPSWMLRSSKMDDLVKAYIRYEKNEIPKGTLKCIARDYVRAYDIVRGEFEVYDVKLP